VVVGRLVDLVLLVPVGHAVGKCVQVGLQHGVDIRLPLGHAEMGEIATHRS